MFGYVPYDNILQKYKTFSLYGAGSLENDNGNDCAGFDNTLIYATSLFFVSSFPSNLSEVDSNESNDETVMVRIFPVLCDHSLVSRSSLVK